MSDVDRVVNAINELTKQVARVAWALERAHMRRTNTPCASCGSQLVADTAKTCPACGEDIKETKTNG